MTRKTTYSLFAKCMACLVLLMMIYGEVSPYLQYTVDQEMLCCELHDPMDKSESEENIKKVDDECIQGLIHATLADENATLIRRISDRLTSVYTPKIPTPPPERHPYHSNV